MRRTCIYQECLRSVRVPENDVRLQPVAHHERPGELNWCTAADDLHQMAAGLAADDGLAAGAGGDGCNDRTRAREEALGSGEAHVRVRGIEEARRVLQVHHCLRDLRVVQVPIKANQHCSYVLLQLWVVQHRRDVRVERLWGVSLVGQTAAVRVGRLDPSLVQLLVDAVLADHVHVSLQVRVILHKLRCRKGRVQDLVLGNEVQALAL
mmetsp:Transcript_3172/g.11083  ORF Transcript_3172/g.11083 Transcript_3172/m.11083 type:complete len:208 (-) Transcript_3172:268-891(-)